MAWLSLLVAGMLEVAWAVGLKYTAGWTRPAPTALTLLAYALSVVFLERAVRTIPVGTAYTVWTGIGAVGAVTLGVLLFREPVSAGRLAFLAMIVAGIVGLRFTS